MTLYDVLDFMRRQYHDQDIIDRIQNQCTSFFIFLMGICFLNNEFGGNPITCWDKPNFHESWIKYSETMCLVNGFVFVPLNKTLPDYNTIQNVNVLYHWMPFIFFLMAIIIHAPRILWTFITWTSNLKLAEFCNVAHELKDRVWSNKIIIKYVKNFNFAFYKRGYRSFWWWNYSLTDKPSTLSTWYFVYKLFNIASISITFFILNIYFADTDKFGYDLIMQLLDGQSWRTTEKFAVVQTCSFLIREMDIGSTTRLERYTVQCVIPNNQFYKKLYIILWFWLSILAFLQICSFCLWIRRMLNAENFIKDSLNLSIDGTPSKFARQVLNKFCRTFPSDGYFAIYMFMLNGGNLVANKIVLEMFEVFQEAQIIPRIV